MAMSPFQGVWEVKTIFRLRYYLPVSLSFFYEYTVDFSRGCHVILQQTECRSRYEAQLSSVKLDVKEICKNVDNATLLTEL